MLLNENITDEELNKLFSEASDETLNKLFSGTENIKFVDRLNEENGKRLDDFLFRRIDSSLENITRIAREGGYQNLKGEENE